GRPGAVLDAGVLGSRPGPPRRPVPPARGAAFSPGPRPHTARGGGGPPGGYLRRDGSIQTACAPKGSPGQVTASFSTSTPMTETTHFCVSAWVVTGRGDFQSTFPSP